MRLRIGIFGFLVCGGIAQAQTPGVRPDSGPPTITLADAIQRSLQIQPAMVSAVGAQRNAGAARTSAFGTFLPSVTAGWSAAKNSQSHFDNNRSVLIPPTWNYGLSFNASVDLFDGLKRIWGVKSASAVEDAADAGYISQRFVTELQTKEAFFAALANQELLRVAQAQLQRTEQELKAAADKLRFGAATRADSLTAAVDHGNAEVALLQAQANLTGAQAALARQIGVNGLVQPMPDSTIPVLPDTAGLLAAAVDNAPLVQQADAQATAARAGVLSARSQYFPTFTVSFGDNRSDTTFGGGFIHGHVTRWTFGASLPLFNGFSREQSQVSASVTRDIAVATAADTRRNVAAQLAQQVAALVAAYHQMDIAQANRASATEALRVQQQRYAAGAGLLLDLLTAEANLTQAEATLIQARFTYRTTRATIESLVGKEL
ncbi:MAG TPA: TolC family protein [Gemmatimonadales bacterium]|nr:TolC family protein [Gemmatimonadales bacterium]